ncbi:MAG TPA: tRNA (guanosine(37)-N1)-methyltransferase TrmD [Anaerolineae bacterium]|nr:tRNA (guanosine(37)-N1)-methyltransferase TrmD [Anaerolineae bacterium]
MRFDIFTLFPGIFESPLRESMLKRALESGLLDVQLHNIRDYAEGRHQVTDDYPYGGGGGMVMKPEPVFAAVENVLGVEDQGLRSSALPIVLLTPQGRVFNQQVAFELAQYDRVALICGRYEGFDERIREHLTTDEISIGDYVLTGGELAALIVVDAVIRLKPGVLGDPTGAIDDSHVGGLLEYPHYTRPPEFRGWGVPEVLLSGDHARVDRWRREQAMLRTWQRRPELLERAELTESERSWLQQFVQERER